MPAVLGDLGRHDGRAAVVAIVDHLHQVAALIVSQLSCQARQDVFLGLTSQSQVESRETKTRSQNYREAVLVQRVFMFH